MAFISDIISLFVDDFIVSYQVCSHINTLLYFHKIITLPFNKTNKPMQIAIIGGAGTIGSTVAYSLSIMDPELEIFLVDINQNSAEGHALDLSYSSSHLCHPVGMPIHPTNSNIIKTLPLQSLHDLNPDLLIITASIPRPVDSSSKSSTKGWRLEFLKLNKPLITSIGAYLESMTPIPVIVVTNPLDRITYHLWKSSNWPRKFFVGYSLSEQARMAYYISQLKQVDSSDVYCPVLGEHGDHVVPIFSRAKVQNMPLEFSLKERQNLTEQVRDAAYEVIRLRGTEDSSRWVTGRGVSLLALALLSHDLSSPIPLSVPLEGEYGFNDVCLIVPVLFSNRNVTKIVEWDLSEEEKLELQSAYNSVKSDCVL
ncbi:MAG: malate dehydrogenase [Halobacteriales archaeon]